MKAAGNLKATKFLGYETLSANSEVVALFSKDGQPVKELKGQGFAVFQQTPFYAESGGQVGDHGEVHTSTGTKAEIADTIKFNDIFFHAVDVKTGALKEKDKADLTVNPARRSTMRNHSATHLLHAALRKVLGTHVSQAGSLVEAARLRFDFTHTKPLSHEEVSAVETLVNQEISTGRLVDSQELPYKEAIKSGAMALFGEKYGDKVRVIKMGDFSTELCGGTHVDNTADIRVFKITSEGGISSGVRRIEAVTGDLAVQFLFHRHQQLAELEETLKVEEGKAPERVKKVMEAGKKLERDLKNALVEGQTTNVEDILKSGRDIKGVKVISAHVAVTDRDVLSQLADKIKDKIKSGVIVLIGASADGAPSPLVTTVTKDLVGKYHAGNILKNVAAVMDGKGGGRPDFAQGAAPNAAKAQDAATKAFDFI
jgi:alanyl-tRNA synthetase